MAPQCDNWDAFVRQLITLLPLIVGFLLVAVGRRFL